ncbi:MAG: class I SAM-dependent methyltransferase [Chloroflexi bacterium]|nr:class I SAM-dependent methyltransferase [Chloroflexota bacterium]
MSFGERIFAALYNPLTRGAERGAYRRVRPQVTGGVRGRLLEIGGGTGANLPYYPTDVALTIVDPNPHMLRRLEAKARKLGLTVTTVLVGAEELPFDDASFDTVVGTIVLCSVTDQRRSLGEIRRVLRPGGEFRFMEHVRAASGAWAHFQDGITPLWKRVGAGCHPNRDTVSAIRAASFEIVELKEFPLGPYPVRPHVFGVARRLS